ncbi:uncharacterized protein EDB91DRAFT_1006601, partial [Suillus paluster]|uniref:uncharacterized protein n=1 Tax=Suillus paluster TaxID=48578 RepID=UPI001B8871D5
PALLPLPQSSDKDLSDPVAIAEACGYTPTVKTAGSRCKVNPSKGKGRGKENSAYSTTKKRAREILEDDDEARVKRGHPHGSNNYSSADMKTLLNVVEEELPLGQRGWQAIHAKFAQWAKRAGRPDRKVTSLETKFKQLVKTTKPTGDGVCPPEVSRAHEIDHLINECAGTHDVNDMDLEDDDNGLSLVSAHESPHPVQHTAVARSVPTEAPVPCRRGPANELLNRISGAFDPDAIRARDDERANRTLANTHFLTQSQQLRDAQGTIKNLHNQLFELRTRLNDIERARDKAELCVEM